MGNDDATRWKVGGEFTQDLWDKYGLQHGNAEWGDGWVIVEGPQHTTLHVDVTGADSEAAALKLVSWALTRFDVDDEFTDLWTPEFGECNGFSPRALIRVLEADQRYFREVARRINVATRLVGQGDGVGCRRLRSPTCES